MTANYLILLPHSFLSGLQNQERQMKDIIEYIHGNPHANKGTIVSAFVDKYSSRSIRLFLSDCQWLTVERGANNASLYSITPDAYELAISELGAVASEKIADNSESRFIYGIQIVGEQPIKVGIARNLRKRIDMLQVGHYKKYVIVFAALTTDFYRIEKELHLLFADKRIGGEWFNITASDLAYEFNDITWERKI